MVADNVLLGFRVTWLIIFVLKFIFYGGGLYYYNEFALPRFTSVLVDNLFVSGLTALVYLWLLVGGDPAVRWIAYALCSAVLVRTAITYLTCPPPYERLARARRQRGESGGEGQTAVLLLRLKEAYRNESYYGALVATFITVLSGYVLAQMTPGSWPQWLAFAVSLVPFIFIGLFFSKAIGYLRAARSPLSDMTGYIWFAAFIWLAYPALFALSPEMVGVISANSAELGYALADLFTKVLFGLLLSVSLRKQCGLCDLACFDLSFLNVEPGQACAEDDTCELRPVNEPYMGQAQPAGPAAAAPGPFGAASALPAMGGGPGRLRGGGGAGGPNGYDQGAYGVHKKHEDRFPAFFTASGPPEQGVVRQAHPAGRAAMSHTLGGAGAGRF